MDRVARWRQMQQAWAKDTFLRNGAAGGNKDCAPASDYSPCYFLCTAVHVHLLSDSIAWSCMEILLQRTSA